MCIQSLLNTSSAFKAVFLLWVFIQCGEGRARDRFWIKPPAILILIDCSNSYSRFVRLIPGFTSAIQCVPFHQCMRRRAVLRDLQQGFGCGWEEAHPHKAWLILENVRCGVGNEVLMTAFIFGPLACGLHWH